MKKAYIIISLLSVFAVGAKPTEPFPQAEITNGFIHARLYLPDTSQGYYRGSRFDWSGVMPELEHKGHSYFGQWFDKYNPTFHDAIMGPVEDFAPVGYNDAREGEGFLKIGIGMLAKPDEPTYFFVNPYKIINPGSWQVMRKPNEVGFTHNLVDKDYCYVYNKTVALEKGKPILVLSHTLKNTGKLPIETNVYDHNFFVIDHQPVGTAFRIRFPYNLSGLPQGTGNFGEIRNNEIVFLKDLGKNEHLQYLSLQGFGNSAKDYDIRVENIASGAGVRITSNQPLSKLAFWSAPVPVCPEPFISIKVKPGETFSWKIFYEFYTINKNN